MAMDDPACPLLTNAAPLTAAATIAARPAAEVAIARRLRARMARTSTLTPATSNSSPSAPCTASTTGWLVRARPSAVASPAPWSAAGTRA